MYNRIGKAALLQADALIAVSSSVDARADESEPELHKQDHTLGIFLGDTTENRRDGVTLGLEYEYRFSRDFGAGLTVEHIAGDFTTEVLVAPLALHQGPWKLYLEPGVELAEDEAEPLLRLGVEYGIELGEWEVSPQVDVDFVDGEALLVIGVVFAWRF